MADARITELTSAAWSSGLTFAVVDAGTTKRIGSDQFGLTTTAQASTVAQAAIVAYGAVTTAQASAIADDAANALLSSISVITSAIGDLSTGSGTAVSAAISKDEALIVCSGVGLDSNLYSVYVQLVTNGGTLVTGYNWWASAVRAAGPKVISSPASSAGFDLAAPTSSVSTGLYNFVVSLAGLRGTSAGMKKTMTMTGTDVGAGSLQIFSGGGYIANTSAVVGVRVAVVGANYSAGSITFMQR